MKSAIAIFLICLVPLTGAAKSTRETTYRYDQLWNTAVRFLRVDNGFPIIEKDRKSGYLMFDYTDNGTKQIGSVELVETVKDGQRAIAVGIRIQNMPSYIEVLLLDKLERKLRDEYGDPPLSQVVSAPNRRSTERGEDESSEDDGDAQDADTKETEDSVPRGPST